ncbi:CRTAC1 family protein [Bryocella elongata]|nr:CRTAC1 family protein [Bryocella elongata]
MPFWVPFQHLRWQIAAPILFPAALVFCGGSIGPLPATAQSDAAQQTAQEGAQAPAHGGSNTAGVFAPVYDAKHRPITAGGTVAKGAVPFEEIAKKAGLAGWHHTMGSPNKPYILDTIGSGVALLDYDNDGWLDIYLVNGSTDEAEAGKAVAPHAALFHNNHDGTFTDVTAKAGVSNDRWGFGVAVGDYDNDGWPDLYVSNFGKNRLYHNNHDGTFTDVADKAGVALGNWSTGATWGDYDGDGQLDLFVPGYVHYDLAKQTVGAEGIPLSFCQYRGAKVLCGPRGLPGEPDHLFHNNGDGTFTDVSEHAGVADKSGYFGLSSVFVSLNGNGKVDLLVANDSTPNYLYLNKGDGTFEDISYASGYALNKEGRETASMGIALGDYRNNGQLDVFNTTFSDDYKPLYRNDGDANFTDVSYDTHIAQLTIPFLGWGTAFLDYDNDGWKDLLEVNGHVYRNADTNDWGTSWAQRALLFHNEQGKRLEPLPAVEGTALAKTLTSRGLAVGDLFNDGRMDAVINNMDSVPALFRNIDPNKNHWVAFKLTGGGKPGPDGRKSPRDAIGATVYLTANGMRQRGDVFSGGSYASTSDMRPHFGLGATGPTLPMTLEVHWPSGNAEKFLIQKMDAILDLTEGSGSPLSSSAEIH